LLATLRVDVKSQKGSRINPVFKQMKCHRGAFPESFPHNVLQLQNKSDGMGRFKVLYRSDSDDLVKGVKNFFGLLAFNQFVEKYLYILSDDRSYRIGELTLFFLEKFLGFLRVGLKNGFPPFLDDGGSIFSL
jgi:hypothetical protein